jgi:hypothetical protein
VDLRVSEVPGTHRGAVGDPTKRLAITGPCTVPWQEGMRLLYAHRYPDGPDAPPRPGGATAHAMRSADPTP